jgi:branched-chain amino acid transport system permease protein
VSDLIAFTIFGLSTGAIYAVAASGLVVTYTTSGIFNFSHGAVGMLSAFAYWQIRFDWGVPAPIALFLVLVVIAPLLGAVVERVIIRGLDDAPEVAKLVVPIGLLVGFIGLANVIWDRSGRSFPRFFGDDATIQLMENATITWHDVVTMVVAILVAVGLTAFLRLTRIGTAMRAVVDSRSLAQLNGARPNVTSMLSWSIGFSLAALAGILLAPVLRLDVLALTFLVVNAYAAAMFGRLRSLPMTFLGGLLLGLVESYSIGYLDPGRYPALEGLSSVLIGLRTSIPVIMLFIVLLVLPSAETRGHAITRVRQSVPRPTWRGSLIAAAVLVMGVGVLSTIISGDQSNLGHLSRAMAFGVIILSFVPLVGYGGQISLAQMGLAGIGAVIMSKWSIGGPVEDLLALTAAFVIPGLVGAIIALPALRLRGIYLALATFAFAVFLDKVVFVQTWTFGGSSLRTERFELFGVSTESNQSYAIFLAVMFAGLGLAIVALRRGPFGRRLQAMKDSPAACATLGIDLTRTKFEVFGLSAGIAGVGGALLAMQKTSFAAVDFEPTQSLVILLMGVAGGVAMVSGALAGGALFASFGFWIDIVPDSFTELVSNMVLLAPGLIGISLGRNPNGLMSQITTGISRQRDLWATRHERKAATTTGPAWDLETLGLDRPFSPDDVEAIDVRLEIDGVVSVWNKERSARARPGTEPADSERDEAVTAP